MNFFELAVRVLVSPAFLGITAVFLLALLKQHTLRYELREDALYVLVLGLAVRRVPYANMKSARRGLVLWAEKWKRNSADPNLTLQLRRGLFKNFVINPPDSQNFLAQLQSYLTP